MNVLFVLFGNPAHAAATRLRRFMQSLEAHGVSSALFVFHGDDSESRRCEKLQNERHFVSKTNWLFRPAQNAIAIRKVFIDDDSTKKFDAVVVYGCSFLVSLTIRLLKPRSRLKILADITEFYPLALSSLTPSRIDYHLLYLFPKLLDGVFCISSFLAKYWERKGLPVCELPSFYATDWEVSQTVTLPCETVNLLYVGSMSARDKPGFMLDMLQEADRRGLRIHLNVVGNLEMKAAARDCLQRVRARPELARLITFHGRLDRESLKKIVESTSAFVLFRDETIQNAACFPTRLPEFLATGRPVVISGTTNIMPYLKSDDECYVIPPGDSIDEAINALRQIINDPASAANVGRNGMRMAQRRFGISRLGQKASQFLDAVSNRECDAQ